MDERTEARIEGWDSKPLTGGFPELQELADGGFSGVARVRGTTLFMLNGRIVGVFGGSIDDFADAQATAHQAPHPSLPLLFAMKEYSGEQQAKYYTNDTPISKAHQQLGDAQFTGYIELSENVLSGDYYVLYYGGRSMSCAFVGNSERLEAGDEAFQLADDEVGIYEVMAVDIEVTDIPDGTGASGAGGQPAEAEAADASTDTTSTGAGRGDQPPQESGVPTGDKDATAGAKEPVRTPDERNPGTQPRRGDSEVHAGAGNETDVHSGPEADAGAGAEASAAGGSTTETGGAGPAADGRTNRSADVAPANAGAGAGQETEAAADQAVEAASGPQGSTTTGTATARDGVPKSEAALGDLRAIPSLSPDQTAVAEPGAERGTDSGQDQQDGGSAAGTAAEAQNSGETTSTAGQSETTDGTPSGAPDTPGTDVTERATREVDVDVETGSNPEPIPDDADAADLRQQLRAREERIEDLEAAITDFRVQRDGLTDERDRLESEVARLESEVSDLESEVERLQSRLDDGTEGKQRLSVENALEGTNLFIRYNSKSGGTLEKAHRGEVGEEEVNNNLRLEHHTQFDADDVVVNDVPFGDFLRGTIYRGFVEWVVRDLLYEIQKTDHVTALSDLYDAIPQIDRAELLGDVSVQYTEDGEEYREQRSFDVVLRDRMGNPLLVANLNDSRNPADQEMMETVIRNGSDVKVSNESLASSMMVTASFFKPGALEAADEAAGGGLLSRESKTSYVKTNRKSGYHLVLVESRDGDFHVNVPEL